MPSTDSEGRTRFTHYTVVRDPNGPVLHKNQGPPGLRTPNGFIWAHAADEFVYIPRVPSVPNYVTTWSRSMLKTLGESYAETAQLWEDPLVPPRVVRPWPVLQLPFCDPAQPDPPLGAMDEGCEWEHSDFMCYTVRAEGEESESGKELAVYARPIPRRCPSDPSEECTGRVVYPDESDSSKTKGEMRYDFVWCKHFKARLEAVDTPESQRLIARAITELTIGAAVADSHGVKLPGRPPFVTPDGQHKILYVDNGDSDHGSSTPTQSSFDTTREIVEVAVATAHQESKSLAAASVDLVTGGSPDASVGHDLVEHDNEDISEEDKSLSDNPRRHAQKSNLATGLTEGPSVEADLFSTGDLPKLEEFIPDSFLPDVLLVHDPDRTTNHSDAANEPVKYKRVVYRLPSDAKHEATETHAEQRIAHLHLRAQNRLGTGHHSTVYSAPLTLPPPLSAYSRTGQVTVAAKIAFPHCTAHTLLHNEARAYARIPRHAQEEYCGFNIVPPCRFPVPVGSVVPKCYGFYLPVGDDGEVLWREEEGAQHCECRESAPCTVGWTSPILLMEDCGTPVEPAKFTVDERTECFSLVLRLHNLGITQGSFYVRNIMIQPGPLSRPPAERSFTRPSFRIIDFGRARCLDLLLAGVKGKERRGRVVNEFRQALWDEENQAREELLVEACGF